MLQLLGSPIYQFAVYCGILLLVMVFSRLNENKVIYAGVISHIGWMIIAGIYSIKSSVAWSDLFINLIAFIIGYLVLWGAVYLSEKMGTPYNGEGAIMLLAPLVLSVLILIPIVLIKLIWHYFVG